MSEKAIFRFRKAHVLAQPINLPESPTKKSRGMLKVLNESSTEVATADIHLIGRVKVLICFEGRVRDESCAGQNLGDVKSVFFTEACALPVCPENGDQGPLD